MSSRRRTSFMVLASALLLAACSGGGENTEARANATQRPGAAEHVWKAEVDAIAKACGVEAQLQGAAERQRRSIGE